MDLHQNLIVAQRSSGASPLVSGGFAVNLPTGALPLDPARELASPNSLPILPITDVLDPPLDHLFWWYLLCRATITAPSWRAV